MSKIKWFFLIVIGLGILYAINHDLFVQLTPAQKRLKLVDSIAKDYANSHTYSKRDLFVCVDMAMDLWNQLHTQGIKTIIKAGSVSKEMNFLVRNDPESFIREMDHVWLIFEVENDRYLPLETTGGFIVFNDTPNGNRYFIGLEFENPRLFKAFMEARERYFTICKQAEMMRNAFNETFAGRRVTKDAIAAKGMCEFKDSECQHAQKKLIESISRGR